MSRSVVMATVAAAALLIGLALWFTAPDADHDDVAQLAPTAATAPSDAVPEPARAELPAPAEFQAAELPSPLGPGDWEPIPVSAAPEAGLTTCAVFVSIDGRPLVEALHELGIEQSDARALATREYPPMRLDEALAPAFERLGMGSFAYHRNWFNEDISVGPPGCFGQLEFPADFPLHVSVSVGSAVLATRRLDSPQAQLHFELSRATLDERLGRLRLRVVSAEQRTPIAGAEYVEGLLNLFADLTVATTGADGLLERWATPGTHAIELKAQGYERRPLEVRVPPGELADLGDVELRRAVRISGRVRLADGSLPADSDHEATVVLVPMQSSTDAYSMIGRRMGHGSTKQGRFDFLDAGPERYLIVALVADDVATLPVDARRGDVSDLELTLGPSTKLLVRLPSRPLDSVRLRLWTKAGLPVASWPNTLHVDKPEWEIWLVPGDYVLAGHSRSLGKWSRAITIGAEPLTIDVPP